MSAKSILESVARKTGWNESSMLEILCDFIDNHDDDDCFEDFVREYADNEAEDDDDVGEDEEEEDIEVDGQ